MSPVEKPKIADAGLHPLGGGATHKERIERGRSLRATVSRSSLGDWSPGADRPDPVARVRADDRGRVPDLIPIRHQRMSASAFAFLRGTAGIMAADLATGPATGLRVEACGDAHLANFGDYGTPERRLVFDIDDFDETLPAPFEWDVKRLATSVALLLATAGAPASERRTSVASVVGLYRRRIAAFAEMSTLDVWYANVGVANAIRFFARPERPLIRRDLARARKRTNEAAIARLTTVVSGRRRFRDAPPLLVPVRHGSAEWSMVETALADYRQRVPPEVETLLGRFHVGDVARKVVGVGSVGRRCLAVVLEGPDGAAGDAIMLQVKEALESVLEPYAGRSRFRHHGDRVVAGQRLTQHATDILLGSATVSGRGGSHDFYIRQLWDLKGSSDPGTMDKATLLRYARLCAAALARGHARTGDAIAMSAYMGRSTRFDTAIAAFADIYQAQVTNDCHRFRESTVQS
ncbi:MAG TPA: DUF2252 domain-containing protein [Acidimicrobiales bacterium]|nr:DUF2252 domain-containing protein [Acidimicrobiales bacterium]